VSAPTEDVTDLLNQWTNGDEGAGKKVFGLVCRELRRVASRSMNRQASSHKSQTTALVHEAYIRLTGDSVVRGENRGHCFGVAANAFRHCQVDARAGAPAKRRCSAKPLTPRQSRISPETVARDWRAAKAWLYSEMAGPSAAESGNDA
jgi:hypothetical protein